MKRAIATALLLLLAAACAPQPRVVSDPAEIATVLDSLKKADSLKPAASLSVPTRSDTPVLLPDTFPPLVVSPHVLNAWAWLFAYWNETEWGMCLWGQKRGRTVFIESGTLGFIYSANDSEITFGCPSATNFLGYAHSHQPIPDSVGCKQSRADKEAVHGLKVRWFVDIIICGPDRFAYVLETDSLTTHPGSMPAVRKK